MITDWHSHWIPPEMADRVALHRELPTAREFFDVEARLRHMDEAGVTRQVVCWPATFGFDARMPVSAATDFYREYNERLAAMVVRWPERFTGLAVLPMADPQGAADELSRASQAPGLIGAVVPADAFLTPAIASQFQPLLAQAQRLKSHLYVHPGPIGPAGEGPIGFLRVDASEGRWLLEAGTRLAASALTLESGGVLDPYPDLTVHVAMLGGHLGMIAETLVDRAAKRGESLGSVAPLRRIYVDTGILRVGGSALALGVAVFGPDRILFGSDFPQFGTPDPAATFRASGLTPEVQSKILFENGEALIRRPRPAR
jgi:predicted TIM-barrel fold metal-dependent hydrolase